MNQKILILLITVGMLIALIVSTLWIRPFQKTIKIGILHSQTGILAANEQRLIKAELLAIDQINQRGGILGKKLEPVFADCKSDEITTEKEALRLITQEHVEVLVGCWLSASRKRVKPIVEKYNNLLLYPITYEGLEESSNIIYFGALPNQTTIPALSWAYKNLGKRFALISVDSLFSRSTHKIIELHLAALGGSLVESIFIKLEDTVHAEHIQKIIASQPNVIINTLSGAMNESFFQGLVDAGITSDKIPTFSLRISQADFKRYPLKGIIGTYVLFTYAYESNYLFNQRFIEAYKQKYGPDSNTGESSQAAYSLVHCWAKAYEISKSSKPELIVPAFQKIVYQSPTGIIYVEKNNNVWSPATISRLAFNGDLIQVWTSNNLIRPEVYPPYLSKDEWNQFTLNLYKRWGNRWSAA